MFEFKLVEKEDHWRADGLTHYTVLGGTIHMYSVPLKLCCLSVSRLPVLTSLLGVKGLEHCQKPWNYTSLYLPILLLWSPGTPYSAHFSMSQSPMGSPEWLSTEPWG